jgi:hypothetical protein
VTLAAQAQTGFDDADDLAGDDLGPSIFDPRD